VQFILLPHSDSSITSIDFPGIIDFIGRTVGLFR